MKTYTGLRATLAALCAFCLVLISAFSPSRAGATETGPVTLQVFSSRTGSVTKAQMEAPSLTAVTIVPAPDMAAARAQFGFVLKPTGGGEGTLAITRISYDLVINGTAGLDGNNVPQTNRGIEVYLNPQVGSGPYLRGFRADGVTVITGHGTPIAGSTLANAGMLDLEGFGFDPTGSTRRPRFTAPGQYYSVTFHVTGQYNAVPFDVTATAWVLTAAVPTSLGIDCFDSDSVNLIWTDGAGETGYRIEWSEDGMPWATLATLPADATAATAIGLDVPGKNYLFRVVTLGVGPLSGDSAPSNSVAPPRIVSTAVNEGTWIITVHAQPFSLDDMQFSSDLVSWGVAPEGTTVGGEGTLWTVRVPMSQRGFARIMCDPPVID